MKWPVELLHEQFARRLVRGAIIRFPFDKWADPARNAEGPKFGVVLNNAGVSDPIYLALTTSRVEKYDVPAFRHVTLIIEAGEYECLPVRTAIVVREDPTSVARAQLLQKLVDEKLTFEGDLKPDHLAALDSIIRQGFHVSGNLIPHICPPER